MADSDVGDFFYISTQGKFKFSLPKFVTVKYFSPEAFISIVVLFTVFGK